MRPTVCERSEVTTDNPCEEIERRPVARACREILIYNGEYVQQPNAEAVAESREVG